MKTVALVGTFDTKGEEFAYVSSRLKQLGVGVLSIHCGVFEPKMVPDISNEEVARAAGVELAELEHRHDRALATAAMTRGVEQLLPALYAEGRLDGVFSMGGSGGTTIATRRHAQRCPSACPR